MLRLDEGSAMAQLVSESSLFERIWICVYNSDQAHFGRVRCFDVAEEIPTIDLPETYVSLSNVVGQIERAFRGRNRR
jgi:hypothetical protein